LVVASLKQAGPVQRYRDEQVGAREDVASGAVHPAPERPGHMGPVPMLQPEHQVTAVLVVPQYRSRPIPAAPLAGAGAAHRILSHRVLKRGSAGGAPRRREKRNPAPAPAAQSIGLADRFAARKTARRQNPVDD